jgi:TusA-related sulfurtransferase
MPRSLDVTREVCPMTYVRVKLALEDLGDGELLEVVLSHDEALRGVPRSLREEGHEVVALEEVDQGRYRLTVRKGPSPGGADAPH